MKLPKKFSPSSNGNVTKAPFLFLLVAMISSTINCEDNTDKDKVGRSSEGRSFEQNANGWRNESLLEEEVETKKPERFMTKYPILIPDLSDLELEDDGSDTTEPFLDLVSTEGPQEEEIPSFKTGDMHYEEGGGDVVLPGYFLRSCGTHKEQCPGEKDSVEDAFTPPPAISKGNGTIEEELPMQFTATRPRRIDFMQEPFYCRCDRVTCDLYGDCCATVAKKLVKDNPWRCVRVQHKDVWALMISKCPDPSDPKRIHCEQPDRDLPTRLQTYLHDLPIYNNYTGKLYRNIYCAECNKVPPGEIYPMKVRVVCSSNFTTEEKEAFIARAEYQPGLRQFTDWEDVCGIYASELDNARVGGLIPGIRFCRQRAFETCPPAFASKEPLTAALCSSYTQYVISKPYEAHPGHVFKNPHCALCYGIGDLKCLHEPSLPGLLGGNGKTSPAAAGVELSSAGLPLIFDFSTGLVSQAFVGFHVKCPGLQVWDFLRQKCTQIQCEKGYTVHPLDGTCQLVTSGGDKEDPGKGPGFEVIMDDLIQSSPSSCYVLILHEDEYTLLPNDSILVNQTKLGTSSPDAADPVTLFAEEASASSSILFLPGEYRPWNGSSVYVCARNLGVSARFSSILNSISQAALTISVIFSFLHLLLFVLLPKSRNLPGKNLACLTLSLFISQLTLLTLIKSKIREVCLVSAILLHFFFLASFFWMNIMSLDIWRTFSSEFMLRRGSNKSRTFFKYSAYAWLIPGGIVGVAVGIDYFARGGGPVGLGEEGFLQRIRPLYGYNNLCWIGQGLALFLFFALPAAGLLGMNLILFTLTAKAILDQGRDAKRAFKEGGGDKNVGSGKRKVMESTGQSGSGKRSTEEVDRMKLYGKLGLIMGLTWILGFLSGIEGWGWLWYPFVIVNGLQGAFIFAAFDFKVKVWNMLRERLQELCGRSGGGSKGESGRDFAKGSSRDGTTTTTRSTLRSSRAEVDQFP